MTLFFSVEDREGESLSEIFELDSLGAVFPNSGICLRFVRGDTDASFNYLQTPALLTELEDLQTKLTKDKELKELERVIKVCRKFAGKVGTFIRFYGESQSEE